MNNYSKITIILYKNMHYNFYSGTSGTLNAYYLTHMNILSAKIAVVALNSE